MRMKLAVLAFALGLALSLGLFVMGASGMNPLVNQAQADEDNGDQFGFHFLAQSEGPSIDGVNHRFTMTGEGKINHHNAVGGGSFNHWNDTLAGPPPPEPILASGTWKVKSLTSFTVTDDPNNPWGQIVSGVAVMEIRLFPEGGPKKGIPATLTVVCNIGAAGVSTGQPEGFFLEVGDLSFEPFVPANGLTAFTLGPGPDNDD